MENLTSNSSFLITDRDDARLFATVIVAVLSFFVALFNIVCIAALLKSPKLQKSRFHFLTSCLSVGDSTTMIFVIVVLTNSVLEMFDCNLPYLCSVCSSFIFCSVLFSLFQTLSICIERFIATSVTNKTPKIHVLSKILGMKKLMVVFYAICFAYTMAILFGNGFSIRKGCVGNEYTLTYVYLKELPIVFLFLSTIVMYVIVMKRLRRMLTKISFVHQTISELQYKQRLKRHKMNILTLGLLLIVLAFGVLPRLIVAFTGPAQSGNYGNIFLMLPPLINPFIFVLRFVEMRDILKPRCLTCVTVQMNGTTNARE